MEEIILQGHILDKIKEIPDKHVYCCITSPPYYALRDYGDDTSFVWGDKDCEHEFELYKTKCVGGHSGGMETSGIHNKKLAEKRCIGTGSNNEISIGNCQKCGAWKGQLGLEPTPELFIEHLMQVFDEVWRILKPDGSCWVNLGDSCSRRRKNSNDYRVLEGLNTRTKNVTSKSLIVIPEMFVLAMQKRGWIRRNTIIWHKKSAMPSSAKDRFTVDFEYFYFFVKQQKYYFEQQFEPQAETEHTKSRYKYSWKKSDNNKNNGEKSCPTKPFVGKMILENGRNMRTTWTINPQAFPEAHFAVFPEKLVETPIKACCPEGEIVFEPFLGSGTTAVVAKKLGRKYIGIEANPEYIKMATERINAVEIAVPVKEARKGQMSLLAGV